MSGMDSELEKVLRDAIDLVNVNETGWEERLKLLLSFTLPIENFARYVVVTKLLREIELARDRVDNGNEEMRKKTQKSISEIRDDAIATTVRRLRPRSITRLIVPIVSLLIGAYSYYMRGEYK
jgi:hypothetical protein